MTDGMHVAATCIPSQMAYSSLHPGWEYPPVSLTELKI